jgi:hypothetical protein
MDAAACPSKQAGEADDSLIWRNAGESGKQS